MKGTNRGELIHPRGVIGLPLSLPPACKMKTLLPALPLYRSLIPMYEAFCQVLRTHSKRVVAEVYLRTTLSCPYLPPPNVKTTPLLGLGRAYQLLQVNVRRFGCHVMSDLYRPSRHRRASQTGGQAQGAVFGGGRFAAPLREPCERLGVVSSSSIGPPATRAFCAARRA